VVDGEGWSHHAGTEVSLTITEELTIEAEERDAPTIIISPDVVTDLVIQGGTKTTGTRLYGGGFGLVGSITGIAAASAVNGLTRRTSVWTIIKVDTGDGFISIQIDRDEPQVRHLLRPFRDAIVASQGTPDESSHSGADAEFIGHLERLVALRDAGSIDDLEFRTAKARLLGTQ